MTSTVSQTQHPNTIEIQFNPDHPLLEQTLKRYRRRFRGPDLDDIIGDAEWGLFLALGQYDPSSPMPFEAYAGFKIRQAVQEGFRQRDPFSRRARQNGLKASIVAIDAVDEEVETSFQTVEKAFERIDNENLVTTMLDRLDAESRSLIRMRFFEALDVHTMAERTGLHWRGIYRKLETILKALRNTYDRHAG